MQRILSKLKSIILALILGAISLLILIPFTGFIIAVIGGIVGAIIAFTLGYKFFKEKIVRVIIRVETYLHRQSSGERTTYIVRRPNSEYVCMYVR